MVTFLAAGEVVTQLPIPGIFYGVIAFGIMGLFGAITWSFRDVANRNSHKGSSSEAQH